jgi:ATP adenylyltransferase
MRRWFAPWRSQYVEAAGRGETEGCFLCDYAVGEGGAAQFVVHRWAGWFATLNAYPYTNGHLMLALVRHHEGFAGLLREEAEELPEALAACETALRQAYQPHGINVGVNMGRAAGAGAAGHLHVHLLPRWHGDTNFMTAVAETRVLPESLEQSHARLQRAFAALEGA